MYTLTSYRCMHTYTFTDIVITYMFLCYRFILFQLNSNTKLLKKWRDRRTTVICSSLSKFPKHQDWVGLKLRVSNTMQPSGVGGRSHHCYQLRSALARAAMRGGWL